MNRGAPQALRHAATAMVELFKWWRAEMNGLGQALLRLLPSRRSPQLILRIGDGSASLERRVQKAWTTIGTVPANADGTWPAELPGLAPDLRDARTAIVLPPRELY